MSDTLREQTNRIAQQAFFEVFSSAFGAKMYTFSEEKMIRFTELIVKECADIANDHNSEVEGVTLGVGRALKQHFGVEP
jgi:hypothetical protein